MSNNSGDLRAFQRRIDEAISAGQDGFQIFKQELGKLQVQAANCEESDENRQALVAIAKRIASCEFAYIHGSFLDALDESQYSTWAIAKNNPALDVEIALIQIACGQPLSNVLKNKNEAELRAIGVRVHGG